MKVQEIKDQVRAILSDNLDMPVQKIKLASSLSEDLGIDSYGMIQIGYELEEAFHVRIMKKSGTLSGISTVKDVVNLIKSEINGSIPE